MRQLLATLTILAANTTAAQAIIIPPIDWERELRHEFAGQEPPGAKPMRIDISEILRIDESDPPKPTYEDDLLDWWCGSLRHRIVTKERWDVAPYMD